MINAMRFFHAEKDIPIHLLGKAFPDIQTRHEIERNIQCFGLMERTANGFKFPAPVRKIVRDYNKEFDMLDLIPLLGADIELLAQFDFNLLPSEQRPALRRLFAGSIKKHLKSHRSTQLKLAWQSYFGRATDQDLQLLGKIPQAQRLTALNLEGCDKITDAGLQHLFHMH